MSSVTLTGNLLWRATKPEEASEEAITPLVKEAARRVRVANWIFILLKKRKGLGLIGKRCSWKLLKKEGTIYIKRHTVDILVT